MELLPEKYTQYLLPLREQTQQVLRDLKFTSNARLNAQRSVSRLRISAALLNDLRPQDYTTVRFLFDEDVKAMRHYHDDASLLYNLRLSGWLLACYKNPEDIWTLYEAHKLENAFDIEFVLAAGIKAVFTYLQTSRNRNKAALMRKIGSSPGKSEYSPSRLEIWHQKQQDYLELYRFPLKNEIRFAVLMQESERIKELLPEWIHKQKEWTPDTTLQYIGFAKRAQDTLAEVKALEIYTSRFNDRLTVWHKYRLAELYALHQRKAESIRLLGCVLNDATDKELIEAGLKRVCEALINLNGKDSALLDEMVSLLDKQKEKHRNIPAALKRLLKKTLAIQAD